MTMTLDEVKQHDGHFGFGDHPCSAFWLKRVETAPDEDTEWTGIEEETGFVIMVAVGDDYEWIVDPADVTPLDDDAYCHECGQVGCTATGSLWTG